MGPDMTSLQVEHMHACCGSVAISPNCMSRECRTKPTECVLCRQVGTSFQTLSAGGVRQHCYPAALHTVTIPLCTIWSSAVA